MWSGFAAEWFTVAAIAVGTAIAEQRAAASPLTSYSSALVPSGMEQLSRIPSNAFLKSLVLRFCLHSPLSSLQILFQVV